MVAAATPHSQAEGGDLRLSQVDAWGIGARRGLDPVVCQQVDNGLLQQVYQAFYTESGPVQVEHQIGDELTRSMIGDLSATVRLDDGDIARVQNMLSKTGFPQRVNRGMF
jgi:hypothetical protein